MSDKPDDLVLVLLRAMREDIAEIKTDVREIKGRLGLVEETCASLSRRFDRMGDQIVRINTRLDLHETV